MPRDQHYRDAAKMIRNILGADAADQAHAFTESVEALAKVYELAEAYQDHVLGATPPQQADSTSPEHPNPNRSAA